MGYIEGCDEHKLALIEGRCPKCRDKNGGTFILDMQSKCLLEACALYCMICGEQLCIEKNLRDEEFQNAVAGFMVDHVDRHGGDPSKGSVFGKIGGAMTDQDLMTKIKGTYGRAITAACGASTTHVPEDFVAALIANESGADANATRFEPAVFLQLSEVLMGKIAAYSPHGIKRPLSAADLLGRMEPPGQARPPLRSALYTLAELATSKGLTQIMGWHTIEFGREPLSGSPQDQLDFTLLLLGWFAERYQMDPNVAFPPLFHCWNTGTPNDPPATYDPSYVSKGIARMLLYKSLP